MITLQVMRDGLANLYPNSKCKINGLPDDMPAYLLQIGSDYGVFIPSPGIDSFDLCFASIGLRNFSISIEHNDTEGLFLSCSERKLRDLFASICLEFIEPGFDGSRRRALLESPSSWWKSVSELIGNRHSDAVVHGILGELYTLKYLIESRVVCQWNGPSFAMHDLSSDRCDWEVKSTIRHEMCRIHVSGRNQLQSSEKPLFLVFHRFEERSSGILSIQSVIDDLIAIGQDDDFLNKSLRKVMLPLGHPSRQRRYECIESWVYQVDDSFPVIDRINIDSRIIDIEYSLDLTGLPRVTFDQHIREYL